MHHYELFQPMLSHFPDPSGFPAYFEFSKMSFPVTEQACEEEAVWLDKSIFRAGQKGVHDVVLAVMKILANIDKLVEARMHIQ
jgi:hypothetical protein